MVPPQATSGSSALASDSYPKAAVNHLGPYAGHTLSERYRLIRLLGNRAWDVRLAAVERLTAAIGEAVVVEALAARLAVERDDLVSGAIERALARGRRRE